MAIASASVRTSNVTITQASVEIIASATLAYKLMEFGTSNNTATSSILGFGVPAAIGLTPTTPAALVFEDGGNTSTPGTTTALAWATSPTNPTVYSRRVSLPATIGAGICWTFPRGFAVLKAKTLTLSNIVATPAVQDAWLVLDE
jgi:hypothetical protein